MTSNQTNPSANSPPNPNDHIPVNQQQNSSNPGQNPNHQLNANVASTIVQAIPSIFQAFQSLVIPVFLIVIGAKVLMSGGYAPPSDKLAGNIHPPDWLHQWFTSLEQTDVLNLKCKKIKQPNGSWKLQCEKVSLVEEERPTLFYIELEKTSGGQATEFGDSLCCKACSSSRTPQPPPPPPLPPYWLWIKLSFYLKHTAFKSLTWLPGFCRIFKSICFGEEIKCKYHSETIVISNKFEEALTNILQEEFKQLKACPDMSVDCITKYPKFVLDKFEAKFNQVLKTKFESFDFQKLPTSLPEKETATEQVKESLPEHLESSSDLM